MNHDSHFSLIANSRTLSRLVVSVCIIFWIALPSQLVGQQTTDKTRVDFQSQVLPIFRNHCFACHSSENIEGNLDLSSKLTISQGGFSGLPIVGNSLEDSELVRRVRSDDKEYRMPKGGLSLQENEIATLIDWLQQGGSFDPPRKPKQEKKLLERLGDGWTIAEKALSRTPYRFAAMFVAPWLAYFALYVIGISSRRRRRVESGRNSNWLFRFSTFVFASLILIGGAVIGFQQGLLREKDAAHAKLALQLQKVSPIPADPSLPPVTPHPMHPPRLGGDYYRGNDERNKNLFNNGFYQTAQLRLELVDKAGTAIKIGDSVNTDEISVRLKVRRSPNTADGMFKTRTMGTTFVSSSFRGTDSASDRKLLKPIEGEPDSPTEWSVEYPLANFDDASAPITGSLYVYYGPLNNNAIHYAIHYDLKVEDRTLADRSELWMGSTYNLNGRVSLPSPNNILLDRWFDFRPMPTIPDSQEAKLP